MENKQNSWLLLNGGLLAVVMWTAVSVVESSHQCRELYADLQTLQREQWSLQENWRRLLLEEGARAPHHEVQTRAQELLGMQFPAVDEVKRVRP